MTFAIFIILVFGVFIGLLNILPNITAFPVDGANALGSIIAFMKTWDFLLPITELMILAGVVITIEVSIWVWHMSMKVVKFLRGHSDGA